MKSKFHTEGYEAYKNGKALADNPYIGNPRLAYQWKQGWNDAYNLDKVRRVLA